MRKASAFRAFAAVSLTVQLVGASTALAQDEVDRQARVAASRFIENVVRVLPVRSDGQPAETNVGFGIIVGTSGPDLFIVTPHHVAFSDDPSVVYTDHPHVRFHAHPSVDVDTVRLPNTSPPEFDDLAVLVVHNLQQSPHLTLSSGSLQAHEDEGSWVWTIGNAAAWQMAGAHGSFAGRYPDPSSRLIFDGLPTAPGGSGGAVVTTDGIVAMMLDASGLKTLATSIDAIKARLNDWNLPTNLLEVTRDCRGRSGPEHAPAVGKAVIAFDGLSGPNGTLMNCYEEAGFTIAPAKGDWRISTTFGAPAPYVYFAQRATQGGRTRGTLAVTAGGRQFRFQSVDIYASVTPIPYKITGYLDGDKMFIMAGIVPNTFGTFATVSASRSPDNIAMNLSGDIKALSAKRDWSSSGPVDRLEIQIETYTEYAVSSPLGVDNIRLDVAQ